MRLPARSRPAVLRSLTLLLLAAASVASARAACNGTDPIESDRAAIAALAVEILARLDLSEALTAQLAEGEAARKRSRMEVERAERAKHLAALMIQEYEDGSFPQDEQTAKGAIILAKSRLEAAKSDLEDARARRADEASLRAAEALVGERQAALGAAQTDLEKLRNVTHPAESQRLNASLEEASRTLDRLKREHERMKGAADSAKRRVAAEAISPAEMSALAGLDEAIRLIDMGKTDLGREKLREAKSIWSKEVGRRAAGRDEELRERIRAAVSRARPSAPSSGGSTGTKK